MTWLDSPVAPDDQHLRQWALHLWRHTLYDPRRLSGVTCAQLARWIQALDDVLDALPLPSLLNWQRRMDTAHIPSCQLALSARTPTQREPIPYWMPHQLDWLSDFVNKVVRDIPLCHGVPVHVEDDGSLHVWILHLYSGRRRVGDCHDWLCTFGPLLLRGATIHVLSLDTAVCPVTGNLAAGPNFDRILSLAMRGLFTACLAGPPCETWSAVRNVPADPDRGHLGPRPLRTALQPWGLAARSPRETRQTTMGSTLMGHTWMTEAAIVLQGGAALKEHPAPHPNAEYASIWRVPTHESLMMQLPDAKQHCIQQWVFGAAGTKPTTLRALGCGPPEVFQQALFEHADFTLRRPMQGPVGRGRDGKWRTSRAKEYPIRLCRGMAWGMLKALQSRLSKENFRPIFLHLEPLERDWLLRAQSAASRITSSTWLPDYQG